MHLSGTKVRPHPWGACLAKAGDWGRERGRSRYVKRRRPKGLSAAILSTGKWKADRVPVDQSQHMADANGQDKTRVLRHASNRVAVIVEDGPEPCRVTHNDSSNAELLSAVHWLVDQGPPAEPPVHVRVDEDPVDGPVHGKGADYARLGKWQGQAVV